MTGTRALLRLAVRDARRDRWRSLLVLVTVALPVAGLAAAVTLIDTTSPTAEENAIRSMGEADLQLSPMVTPVEGPPQGNDEVTAPLGRLPAGTEVEVIRSTPGTVTVDGLGVPVVVSDESLDEASLAAGRLEVVDGTAPIADDAVSVTEALAERMGVGVGDRTVVDPLGEITVVGVHRVPSQLSATGVVVPAGRLLDLLDLGAADTGVELLVGLPDGVAPETLTGVLLGTPQDDVVYEFVGQTRDQIVVRRFGGEVDLFVLVGGLAAVEVALVAGAAFAVSVRRRQRELGLLAATGATRRHVRRSVLLTGGAVGVTGAVVGVAVGLLGCLVALPWLPGIVDRAVAGLRIPLGWLAVTGMVGVVAAVVGAWWPARTVARLPVLTALSGRRPPPGRSRGGLVVGLTLVAIGGVACVAGATLFSGATLVFLAGCVAVVLGAGLTSPWLLEQLGRLAPHLPVGARLSVRDAARFRTRNGPIVTAAMAGLAGAVTVATVVTSLDAAERGSYEPRLPDNVVVVSGSDGASAGPAAARALGVPASPLVRGPFEAVASPADGEVTTYVDAAVVLDPAALGRLLGPDAVEDLAAGRAVSPDPDGPSEVEVRRFGPDGSDAPGPSLGSLPVAVHERADLVDASAMVPLPELYLPPMPELLDGVRGFGIWTIHLLVTDGPVTDAQVEAATGAAASAGSEVRVEVERGYVSTFAGLVTATTVAGAVAGLLLAAVAIALAAAEARSDLVTLSAVGASRRTRRSLAAGRALLLAGLGGILAVPVGLVPAAALLSTIDGGTPVALPWPTLIIVTVVVPGLAMLGSVLSTRRDGLARAV